MKRVLFFMTVLLAGVVCSCSDNQKTQNNVIPTEEGELSEKVYDWEKNRTEVLNSTDMVLIYAGGKQRQDWNKEQIDPYVTYQDEKGKRHWLFDSFLFLEITSTNDWAHDGLNYTRGYGTGKGLKSADKQDWSNLLDRYFDPNVGIGGLDKSIEAAIQEIGAPEVKRQVVVGIPESVVYQYWNDTTSTSAYWGKLDGVDMDFSNLDHRLKACKWYIDQVRERFDQLKYKNVDLAGFYWIAEDVSSTRALLKPIAEYLKKLKYSFNWIPYFKAQGSSEWPDFGFSQVYYQPNYYFSVDVPLERLSLASKDAKDYEMSMEIEFDETVLAGEKSKAYRLRDYMNEFKAVGVWESKPLAYYQGNDAIGELLRSKNPEDRKLYHEFCSFVIDRPIRKSH